MADENETGTTEVAKNTDPLIVDDLPPKEERNDPNTGKPRYIRMDRFEEVYADYKEYEELINKTDIKGLQRKVTTLEEQVNAHAEEKALWQVGLVDDEALDVARLLYNKMPEDDRPEGGLAGWWDALKEAPDTAPTPLRGYLGTEAAATTRKPPKSNSGTKAVPPPTESPYTHSQIRALKERCARSGDWTEWEEAQPKIRASLAAR